VGLRGRVAMREAGSVRTATDVRARNVPRPDPIERLREPPQPVDAGAVLRLPAIARDGLPLDRALARSLQRRIAVGAGAPAPHAQLQRTITVDATPYTAATLADELHADDNVVWHDEYTAELAELDAKNQVFADHGKLMMWLASATMAKRKSASVVATPPLVPAPVESSPSVEPAPKKEKVKAEKPLTATQVTLAELHRAAPVGGTAGQRYDKQGYPHTSVTFKAVRPDVVKIVGFHRTLANGSHIFWNKLTGESSFVFSSSSGAAIESIGRTKVLEDAWKAVAKTAKKLRCEAIEPTWT
jgi:hypothetical protein